MPGSFGTSPLEDGGVAFTQSNAHSGMTGRNDSNTSAPPGEGNGVLGLSAVPNASGVCGVNNSGGTGVTGLSKQGDGIMGITQAQRKSGVVGIADAGFGAGITGTSSVAHGVHGMNGEGASDPPLVGTGVWGESNTGFGVYGACQTSNGVHGDSLQGDAVVGIAHAQGKAGVLGISDTGNGISGLSAKGIGVFGSGGQFAAFFDGNVRVTKDITLDGADCAEQFGVATVDEAQPGTVMVIGPTGVLHPSCSPYDKKVVGVVSGAGDHKPGIVLDKRGTEDDRLPIALMGKVCCKVDAQYSPIQVGDLLTSSPTPGHAMKADDPIKAFGSVIGKALQPLESGQALISMLIALQ
jgi:hypothetical protein